MVDWIASHPLAFQATSNHLDAKLDDVSHENVESSLPSDQGTGTCVWYFSSFYSSSIASFFNEDVIEGGAPGIVLAL